MASDVDEIECSERLMTTLASFGVKVKVPCQAKLQVPCTSEAIAGTHRARAGRHGHAVAA